MHLKSQKGEAFYFWSIQCFIFKVTKKLRPPWVSKVLCMPLLSKQTAREMQLEAWNLFQFGPLNYCSVKWIQKVKEETAWFCNRQVEWKHNSQYKGWVTTFKGDRKRALCKCSDWIINTLRRMPVETDYLNVVKKSRKVLKKSFNERLWNLYELWLRSFQQRIET